MARQQLAEGQAETAESILRQVVAAYPEHDEALFRLGLLVAGGRRYDEAIAFLHRAAAAAPANPDYHYNLGAVLQVSDRPAEAVQAFLRVTQLSPDDALAHLRHGEALVSLGRPEDAVYAFRHAARVDPSLSDAHFQLAAALMDAGNLDGAAASFRQGLALSPDHAEARGALGKVLMSLGQDEEARAELSRGFTDRRRDLPADPTLETFRCTTSFKLRHDIEQYRYLDAKGVGGGAWADLATAYEVVHDEIDWSASRRIVPLTDHQIGRIGDSYNRAVHVVDAPELPDSAVNPDLDAAEITRAYVDNAPGVCAFDDFLTPAALEGLRRYCLDSTIWYGFRSSNGYVVAAVEEGFIAPLLFQIAAELRLLLPEIIGPHQLFGMWAFKYDSRMAGVKVHADHAAVNVNFWITPDDANLDPDSGGLKVYKALAPVEWDFDRYNRDEEGIRRFLAENDAGVTVVPHRQNRVVLFNSSLFHETDRLRFRDGYENRRINVTMLFGDRRG